VPQLWRELLLLLFQSHAGSIEAPHAPAASLTIPLFQSHAGSIEAGRIRKPDPGLSSFNPTLVRLRP